VKEFKFHVMGHSTSEIRVTAENVEQAKDKIASGDWDDWEECDAEYNWDTLRVVSEEEVK